jgi:hypothetical protein
VNLICDQVAELQHIDIANHDRLLESITSAAVEYLSLAVLVDPGEAVHFPGLVEIGEDRLFIDTVEDWSCDLDAQRFRRDAKVRFQNLADVHTTRHAERVEADLHGRSVREIWHVFLGNDPGNNALVSVTTGHFVTDAQLALARDKYLHLLDDAGIDVIAALDFVHRALVLELKLSELVLELADDLANLVPDR